MSVRRRSLVTLALAALAVLLLAELGARALGPELPAPDRWGDQARAVKAAQLDQLAEAGRCVDVVIAGDSMARDGLIPATISAADPDGRTAYNAALDAASPELDLAWLDDVVLPRARPATVVLAISSIDLNQAGPGVQAALDTYRSAPATRDDLLGRLQRLASTHSALVAHRNELRQPGAVLDALLGRGPGPAPTAVDDLGRPILPGVIDGEGAGLSRRSTVYAGPGPATTFTREQLLAGFDPGQDPAGRVARVVEALGDDGVEVVVVLLPVTGDFAELHPGGDQDLARARRAVREAAEATGAPLVDLLDERWPDARFADTHHLNAEGAEVLSSRLPELARAAGAALPACG